MLGSLLVPAGEGSVQVVFQMATGHAGKEQLTVCFTYTLRAEQQRTDSNWAPPLAQGLFLICSHCLLPECWDQQCTTAYRGHVARLRLPAWAAAGPSCWTAGPLVSAQLVCSMLTDVTHCFLCRCRHAKLCGCCSPSVRIVASVTSLCLSCCRGTSPGEAAGAAAALVAGQV